MIDPVATVIHAAPFDVSGERRRRTSTSVLLHRLERQLHAMLKAFRATGGLVSGDQLAYLVRSRTQQPISTVAHWIVGREIVNFEWKAQTLLPLFQFERSSMTLHPGIRQVVGELAGTYDNWEVAWWFACPNAGLGGAAPVDVVIKDAVAVLDCARADRFSAGT